MENARKNWRVCRRKMTNNFAEPIGIMIVWENIAESHAVKLYSQFMKFSVTELSSAEKDIDVVAEHDNHYYWLEEALDDPYGLREYVGN